MGTQSQDDADTSVPVVARRRRICITVRITLDRGRQEFDVVTHDLSAGGLGADMPFRLMAGETLTVELPNIGNIGGRIAWVVGTRFGVAFADTVDMAQIASPSGKRRRASKAGEARPAVTG